nr:hypothetical protein [Clostridia bacterium]
KTTRKCISIALSILMLLACCISALAAEKTITAPASAYAAYDKAKIAGGDEAYIASLSYDQIAGVLLDWLDRRIADEAADFNAFAESVGVDVQITGVDSLLQYRDHVADLEGDFANLDVSALDKTRADGDINLIFSVFEFMADNADTFGKVFRWDDQVFDYGKVGEFIESDACENQAVKDFYQDYLVTGNIQEKFVAEIAREMGYEIPKNGEERAETFDETISNGVKAWFLGIAGDALSQDSVDAVNAMDLRTTDVYTLVKEFVGLLQNDYKDQFDELLSGFLTALKGVVQVITAGVNVEPPVMTVGYTGHDPYAEYHPYSTEPEDYLPNIYANDQAIAALREYADEDVDVLANSEMTDEDKALVAGTPEAWGRNVLVKVTSGDESLLDLDVDLGAVETAAVAALETAVNNKGMSTEIMGQNVSFTISDAAATFSYNMYKDADSLAAQVKVESATAKVTITEPVSATVTADLIDPDSTTVDFGISFLNSLAQPMVVSAIKTAVGDMFKDPAFATVIVNNLDGKIEELEQIATLMSYIDTDAEYDYGLLDVSANYDEYKGVVGQINHILYGLADMIASDAGMADLGLTDGGNAYLYENLQKICDKVSGLMDTMKQYIDRDTFVNLAETADISSVFASAHGFNAGMIWDMDFSSVENALDCGIRVACDLLAEDDPDSIFYDFHMRVEDLDTLDAIAAAAADMVLEKILGSVDLEGWEYTYSAIDAAAVDAGTLTAEDAILGKATDILYNAAVFAVGKINSAANEVIRTFTEKTGITLGSVSFALNVEQSEDWEITLGALADRFIELTDGLCIPSGAAKDQNGLWDKLTTLADVIPMTSMFSNYDGLAALNADFFDKALDGDMGDFLSHFEVKEDAVAGDVPVTFALINASDYIVDRFFPDTVCAELYADYDPMTEVQEYFTGSESDQGIAARNMVSINGRRAHLVPAMLDLIRESGMLPGFACDHTNVENVAEVASTCRTKGHAAGTKCADCGAVISGCGEYELNKDNHEGPMTDIPAVAPGCTTAGSTAGTKCSACGVTVAAPEVIGPLGHNFVDGRCSVCGEPDPSASSGDDGNSGEGSMNFFQKIADFFRRIINWFRNLFNRG